MKIISVPKVLSNCLTPSSVFGGRGSFKTKNSMTKTGGRALHPLVEEILLSDDEISVKVEEVGRYATAR
jgi:hypothetical protein